MSDLIKIKITNGFLNVTVAKRHQCRINYLLTDGVKGVLDMKVPSGNNLTFSYGDHKIKVIEAIVTGGTSKVVISLGDNYEMSESYEVILYVKNLTKKDIIAGVQYTHKGLSDTGYYGRHVRKLQQAHGEAGIFDINDGTEITCKFVPTDEV